MKAPKITIIQGDCKKTLKTIKSNSVHVIVTSPPYWNLRDYNREKNQIGQEDCITKYIDNLRSVFAKLYRVLRDDGVLWLNLGDLYTKKKDDSINLGKNTLVGLPWRVVFALQDDGWILRSDVVWHKQSGLPESASNRPSKSHEYVFLLTKTQDYYYDVESAKVPSLTDPTSDVLVRQRSVWKINANKSLLNHTAMFPEALVEMCLAPSVSKKGVCSECGKQWMRYKKGTTTIDDKKLFSKLGADNQGKYNGKNLKDKTQKANDPGRSKQSILKSMLTKTIWGWKAGCNCGAKIKKPVVLDPFGGAGTVSLVASRMNCDSVYCELSKPFVKMAVKRLQIGASIIHRDQS